MEIITGKTKLLGVIGDPIEHSLSPVMHNAAIKALGLDYVYVPFAVKSADLGGAIAGLQAINCQGFNVTIPHKQAIIPFLREISPLAQMVGATNTVWREATHWQGTNTDVEGFLAPLREIERPWHEIKPLVLGYGGAARAVVVALKRLGCPEIRVVGRNLQKLADFAANWSEITSYDSSCLPELLPETELLINTTPVGMYPDTDASPIESSLIGLIQPGAIVYDLIYIPNPTKLLLETQKQGVIALDGLEMLVNQGAIALGIWLQRPLPVEIMRQSLKDYLGL
ncbi:shikimate dehydrogenase [Gloeocapsa sp. PCC 73106]|uniref:shikimate dehydrogenase n=1 Tax=Gloeocapsa sp. PCC 73106 TaxID=102232 RepID=UPI0002ACD701|nr:shikimate dehydrogenase [Gloeocapsa sp. PCC 73106]ELR98294.1 shikimate 5-dehydrogenase [Gloeocapsa sp. PCC 73106]